MKLFRRRAVRGPADLDFGALMFALRDVCVVLDAAAARVLLWNPAAETVLGWKSEDICSKEFSLICPRECRDRWASALKQYALTGRAAGIDGTVRQEQLVHRCGTVVPLELTLTPLSRSWDYRRYVLLLGRDISERLKQAEQERDRIAAQATQDAQDRTRLFVTEAFDGFGDALLLLDEELCVRFANRRMRAWLEKIGRPYEGVAIADVLPLAADGTPLDQALHVALGERRSQFLPVTGVRDGRPYQASIFRGPHGLTVVLSRLEEGAV